MSIAARFTIAKGRDDPNVHRRMMDKHYVTCTTVEHYSALKRKEIRSQATTQMSLEDITLSEISQTQKDKYCVILLIRGP